MEHIARAEGGFSHGMAFDREDNLYVCDLKHAAVMKLQAISKTASALMLAFMAAAHQESSGTRGSLGDH
jgi:sugar lactone lactonase YvrE